VEEAEEEEETLTPSIEVKKLALLSTPILTLLLPLTTMMNKEV
jgi:hypothetical protein